MLATSNVVINSDFQTVNDQVIIELRGNGVVMTIYDIELETLEFLKARASRIGDDLSQLWFDPFFWHSKEMHQIKLGLKKAQELRGLMNDGISFMEVRRKGKKRRKYLVGELVGEGQLFPMVRVEAYTQRNTSFNRTVIVEELVFGSGCFARYSVGSKLFSLDQTHLSNFRFRDNDLHFYLGVNRRKPESVYDDFLVRSRNLSVG